MPKLLKAHDELKLTDHRSYYRPFRYPEAYDWSETHRIMNWTREEVRSMHEDVSDWNDPLKMSDEERAAYRYLLSYFTQADVDVAGSYFENLARWYTQPELRIALARIIDREATHVQNYDMLLDQFGIPVQDYSELLEIDEVYEQHHFVAQKTIQGDFWSRVSTVMRHICGEGISLYGQFLLLANGQRFGVMKCLGQEIISWSSRDENQHVQFLSWLLNTEIAENPHLVTEHMKEVLADMMRQSVYRGIAYAESVFKRGKLPDLKLAQVAVFLKQLANARIKKLNLGVAKLFEEVADGLELEWASVLFSSSMDLFFETAGTNYQVGAMSGEWVYPEIDFKKDADKYADLASQ